MKFNLKSLLGKKKEEHKDPICGMIVKKEKEIENENGEKVKLSADGYWFCSKHCFDQYNEKNKK